MRNRPPDRTLTGQEVASSNTTVNALLGGRKKSWMTGASSVVRPSPRTSFSRKSGVDVLPSPAPSDEPSPIQQSLDTTGTEAKGSVGSNDTSEDSQHLEDERNLAGQACSSETSSAESMIAAPPNKKQKTLPSQQGIPTLKPKIEIIDRYIHDAGGFQRLNPACEQPRFSLLRDACNNQDYFYLALHQLFCVWSLDRQAITILAGFSDAFVARSFKILGQLIRENGGLSPVHLRWFSKFPEPLADLLRTSEHYRLTVSKVPFFLNRLVSEWARMTVQCQQRGYPPLVDELVNSLGLLSPVLQGVIFTATRRNMGILDDEGGSHFEKIFNHDRDDHRQFTARQATSMPPSEQERQERNRRVINQYLVIRQQCLNKQLSRRTSSSAVLQTPTPGTSLPNSVAATVGSTQQIPQNSMTVSTSSNLHRSPYSLSTSMEHSSQASLSPMARYANPGLVGSSSIATYPGSTQEYHPSPNYPGVAPSTQQLAVWHSEAFPSSQVQGGHFPQMQPYGQVPHVQWNPSQCLPSHQGSASLRASRQPILTQMAQPSQQNNNSNSATHGRPPPNFILTSNVPTGTSNSSEVPSGSPNVFQLTPTMSSISPARNSPVASLSPHPATKRRVENALIPPPGFVLSAQAPNPGHTALHQAHLRSPVLVPTHPSLQSEPNNLSFRYFQSVKSFALGPVKLSLELALSKFHFTVPEAIFGQIAKDKPSNAIAPKTREVHTGSLQYRMRCVRTRSGEDSCSPTVWVVQETVWPPSVFLEINDHVLELRRKQHYAKDLPIDITPYVVARGLNRLNKISISIPKAGKTPREIQYAFAVEVVEVLRYDDIMDHCISSQRIPANQTLDNIKNSLTGALNPNDDEIAVVASELTIDLADPFMAKLFEIPAKGTTCLHRECFDLETFLQTRPSKPKSSHQISMVDVWKCPLCGKDARPYSLRIDDFLQSVKEKLVKDKLESCKAIIVGADGNWRVKPDTIGNKKPNDDNSDDSDSSDEDEKKYSVTSHPVRSVSEKRKSFIEVIELDDD